jgi:hypothetical protein
VVVIYIAGVVGGRKSVCRYLVAASLARELERGAANLSSKGYKSFLSRSLKFSKVIWSIPRVREIYNVGAVCEVEVLSSGLSNFRTSSSIV